MDDLTDDSEVLGPALPSPRRAMAKNTMHCPSALDTDGEPLLNLGGVQWSSMAAILSRIK